MKRKVPGILTFIFILGMGFGAYAADGAALFGSKCAKCHGPDGKGNPALVKMMGEGLILANAKGVCADTVTKGTGKMKPVALTPEEVTAVCAHAKTLGAK
ncbi:MAG: cytochrome c [Deltaproteobacteria bacterium]|nr:cytochrome c [Deltaproteobacteria bacterium]